MHKSALLPFFGLVAQTLLRRGAVTLPITATLVGIGTQAVYAIRTSPDGLQHVQRFRF